MYRLKWSQITFGGTGGRGGGSTHETLADLFAAYSAIVIDTPDVVVKIVNQDGREVSSWNERERRKPK